MASQQRPSVHGRSIATLLREQAEDLGRHHLRILGRKQFLSNGMHPVRLPSVDSSSLPPADQIVTSLPLSRSPRLPADTGVSPRLLPSIGRTFPATQPAPQKGQRPPTGPTRRASASPPIVELTASPLSDYDPTLVPSPVFCGSPKDPRQRALQKLLIKAASKLKANPGSTPEAVLRGLLDQASGSTHYVPTYYSTALPLVSSLCLRQYSTKPHCPGTIDSAVLMLDICQYSRLTAALAHLGPHILNRCINGCLSPMIDHIQAAGGDVIKFAGDAIVTVWANSRLAESVRHAVACAQWLQENCGHSPIPGTNQTLQIHIGVACGALRSEILYSHCPECEDLHFVSGTPLKEAGEALDFANAAEVCLTEACAALCPGLATEATGHPSIRRLSALSGFPTQAPVLALEKPSHLVSGFVSPTILSWLQQGRDLRSMEANRMLTVLFIYCEAQADVAQWVAEVQEVLKRQHCAILQVIDDDKGIHMVTAFNLYQTCADSGDRSVMVARELRGCTVGVAHGMVFCGLMGNGAASRWDITGFACVRACRLMQQAQQLRLPALFDASVLDTLEDPTVLEELPQRLSLKGTSEPVPGFVPAADPPAPTAAAPAGPLLHRALLQRMDPLLDRGQGCTTFLITGPRGSGKRWFCLRVLRDRDFHVVEHVAQLMEPWLATVWTLATWGLTQPQTLGDLPQQVLDALEQQQVLTVFREGVELVKRALEGGLRLALLVRHVQFLDDMSLRFLAEMARCELPAGVRGRYVQCLTHYHASGALTPPALTAQIYGAQLLELPTLDKAQVTELLQHCLGAAPEAALVETVMARTAGHLQSVAAAAGQFLRGGRADADTADRPAAALAALADRSWTSLCPIVTLKMFHLFDLLPFLQQRMLKVIASITAQPGISAFLATVMEVTAGLLDLDPIHITGNLNELEALGLITLCPHRCGAHRGDDLDSAVCFCPALKDTVLETLLPEERVHINSVAARLYSRTHNMEHPRQFLVRSRHHRVAGELVECRKDLHSALQLLRNGVWPEGATIFADVTKDIELLGGLGGPATTATPLSPPKGHLRPSLGLDAPPESLTLTGLRQYKPPMELGPLGWQVHRIIQTLLAVYASQSIGVSDQALEAELHRLLTLAREYAAALQRVVGVVGFGAHLPLAMAQWPAQEARHGLAATVELAQELFGHIQELTGLAERCSAWADKAHVALLNSSDASLQHLQGGLRSPNVALAVLAAEQLLPPKGPEGEAFQALLLDVKRQCLTTIRPSTADDRLFHTFRSYLAVRAVLAGAPASRDPTPKTSPRLVVPPPAKAVSPAFRAVPELPALRAD